MDPGEQAATLVATLDEARDLGLLGPGPLDPQITHAKGFALAFAQGAGAAAPPTQVLDLGSGGGLPGLVLAFEWPTSRFTLLDAGTRRAAFLRKAVQACALEDRVSVVNARAEEAGRDPQRRGTFALVVARSFAPPAPTAECAAPFLAPGGTLIVSDRPDEDVDVGRWPVEGLARLGMGTPLRVRHEFGFVLIPQVAPCPDTYPRRVGVPEKRPLF